MKITNQLNKYVFITLTTIAAVSVPQHLNAQIKDKIQNSDSFERTITPEGNFSNEALSYAPNPQITVLGKKTNAKFVIDLAQNVLYNYDENGQAKAAYLVATGRKLANGESMTPKGIRIITHVETSPYRTAPRSAKRYNNPGGVYGPKFIYHKQIDPITGELNDDGVGTHGNADYSSLGQYKSKGCIRMDNSVIEILANEVKRGQYILIK